MTRYPDLPCADCGKLIWRGSNSLPEGQATCHDCRAKRKGFASAAERSSAHGGKRGPERPCPVCGEPFRPCRTGRTEDGWTNVCSKHCENIRRADMEFDPYPKDVPVADRNRLRLKRKRAMRRAAFVEKVDRLAVFERDNWICHICGEPVDKTLSGTDPMAPSIDHIVPFLKGGKDCYDNVALAHFGCNARKWVSISPDQAEGA